MRIIYNELSKEIVQVVTDDNSISAYPADLSVIQGSEQSCLDMAGILGLDTTLISNNMSPDRVKVLRRVHRCEQIRMRFLEENAQLSITAQQAGEMAAAFANVMMLLQNGEARTALTLISAMPSTNFPVTTPYNTEEERQQSYIDELNGIITDLFETV